MARTLDCGYRYVFVLGFDEGDEFYDTTAVRALTTVLHTTAPQCVFVLYTDHTTVYDDLCMFMVYDMNRECPQWLNGLMNT